MARFGKKVPGISIAEYALIFALVAVVAIPTLMILGDAIARGYENNEPTSRAGDLFSLLNANGVGGPGGGGQTMAVPVETAGGAAVKIKAESQPVSNVMFNYNAQTGMVEVVLPDGSSAGGMTTSADGTKVLAQNLARLAEDPALTPQQKQDLQNLSNLGFKIAAEERKLLEQYPELADGGNVDLNFFNPALGLDTTLYFDYQEFTKTYETLSGQLNAYGSSQLQGEVDANAALISQLAYKNFVEAQLDPKNGGAEWLKSNAEKEMVTADGTIDIKDSEYTAEETPAVTEDASTALQNDGV